MRAAAAGTGRAARSGPLATDLPGLGAAAAGLASPSAASPGDGVRGGLAPLRWAVVGGRGGCALRSFLLEGPRLLLRWGTRAVAPAELHSPPLRRRHRAARLWARERTAQGFLPAGEASGTANSQEVGSGAKWSR